MDLRACYGGRYRTTTLSLGTASALTGALTGAVLFGHHSVAGVPASTTHPPVHAHKHPPKTAAPTHRPAPAVVRRSKSPSPSATPTASPTASASPTPTARRTSASPTPTPAQTTPPPSDSPTPTTSAAAPPTDQPGTG